MGGGEACNSHGLVMHEGWGFQYITQDSWTVSNSQLQMLTSWDKSVITAEEYFFPWQEIELEASQPRGHLTVSDHIWSI